MKSKKIVSSLFIFVLLFTYCEKEDNVISVQSVTLDETSLSLSVGDTERLVATVTPDDATNKNVVWSSSDEAVATVDQNGIITAIKEGQATITVSSTDGNKTASCNVTVTEIITTITDTRDGNLYNTVTIGNQVWMAENLRYLPEVHNTGGEYGVPYYYVYGYTGTEVGEAKETANYSTYGALYSWEAASTACPEGWHVPSDFEWDLLANYLEGGDVGVGSKLKEAGTDHWSAPDNPSNGGDNQTGFTALPGGFRVWSGAYNNLGNNGYWWSSTDNSDNTNHKWNRVLGYNYGHMNRQSMAKTNGYSVRCIKD